MSSDRESCRSIAALALSDATSLSSIVNSDNAVDAPACFARDLAPGAYRVVLGGGKGRGQGGSGNGLQATWEPGKLTYNFVLKDTYSARLCAGTNADNVKGDRGGGAGSYLKLSKGGIDYYFVAGGSGGHCGGGGGIGSGGGSGGSVESYSIDKDKWQGKGLGATGDTATELVDVGGGGGGGGGSSCNKNAGKSLSINIINQDGGTSSLTKQFGGDGYRGGETDKTTVSGGRTSHDTNVDDPDGCYACAKLYRYQ